MPVIINSKPTKFNIDRFELGLPIEVWFGKKWIRPKKSYLSSREHYLIFIFENDDSKYCIRDSMVRMAVPTPTDLLDLPLTCQQ